MKKLLMAIALIPILALADKETVNGIEWSYTIDGGKAELGVQGRAAISPVSQGSIAIPDKLGGCDIAFIGNGAFYGCQNVTAISIPSTITDIGASAFQGCSSLESITIPAKVKTIGPGAFSNCGKLVSVEFKSSNFWIGEFAFSNCSSLKEFDIPSGVENIPENMFSGCTSLVSVTLHNGVRTIGRRAFSQCLSLKTVEIPRSVYGIYNSVFAGCDALLSITVDAENADYRAVDGVLYDKKMSKIVAFPAAKGGAYKIPDTVMNIGDSVFYGCTALTSVEIPASVTSIGASAFWDCTALTSLEIPSSVSSIGVAAFAGCSSLESVLIPKKVKVISDRLFQGCTALRSVELPDGLESIGTDAFDYCESLKSISIPDNVASVGSGAFHDCSALTSVSLPDGIDSISDRLFCGCSSLKKLTIPNGVSSIGSNAFYGCVSLEAINFPLSVNVLKYGCFNGCESIKELTLHSMNISQFVFANCTSLTSVVFLEGFAFIDAVSFDGCSSLTTLSIPLTVTHINTRAFDGCEALRTVFVDREDAARVKAMMVASESGLDFGKISFIENVCDISFDANGGDGSCSTSLTYGVTVDFPAVSRTGYSFAGWYTAADGGDAVAEEITALSNATYYAHWSANAYFVRYNANGGDAGTMNVMECTYDSQFDIPDCAFTRTGYEFVGWATEMTGDVVFIPGDDVMNLMAVADGMVDLFAVWELAHLSAPQITPMDGTTFGGKCRVSISCSNSDAQIYYRVGATPKASSKFMYGGPFDVAATATIFAFAKWGDAQSVTNAVTLTVGDNGDILQALDATGIESVDHAGNGGWLIDLVNKKHGVSSVRIGSVDDGQTVALETVVKGPGTIAFWWRTSCESDELHEFDRLEFSDGEIVLGQLDGITDWQKAEYHLDVGTHVLRWAYVKDELDSYGEDCGWIDCVTWISDDPIPDIGDNPTEEEIADALEDSEDKKLVENITDGETYNDFRDWAENVKDGSGSAAGPQTVKESPNAWVSFALGSETLLEDPPTDEDLTVEEFVPSAEAGKFDFTVSVEDVEVGSEASKENLKKVFGLEGATSLTPDGFSSDKVDIEFSEPADGKVKFTAGPKDASAGTFFMKVKINP